MIVRENNKCITHKDIFTTFMSHLPSIDAMTLKLIAIITMTLDHIAFGYLSNSEYAQSLDWLISLMRLVGRLAFPLYIFMLTEGIIFTRNSKKYLGRLVLGMILSEIPFDLALYGSIDYRHCSVMVTLVLGYVILLITRRVQIKTKNIHVAMVGGSILAAGVAYIAQILGADYGAYGIMAILACYAVKEMVPGKTGQLFGMLTIVLVLALMNPIEKYALLDLLLILMYNGHKGTKKKSRVEGLMNSYYPIHLSAIALARLFL